MAQVRWSPQVAQDLEKICDYIGRDSPRYAAEMIAQFPLAGGIVPEYGRDDVRERLIHNYRLVYRLRGGDTIQLVTLIHGARILPPLSE